jgi:RND superfamily putative drug exporter
METTLFGRLGHFATRRRYLVIATWIVLLAVMGTFAKGLTGRLTSGGFEVPGSQSLAVNDLLQSKFTDESPAIALVVVHNAHAKLTDPGYRSVVGDIAARVKAIPNVTSVKTLYSTRSIFFASRDLHTTYLMAGLKGDQNQNLKTAGLVLDAAPKGVPAGYQVDTGGGPAFFDRFNEISRQDLEKTEKITFPLTFFLLLLAFGTLVAAGLPILLGIVSLVVTLGALYFLAGATQMSVYVTNTASIIGIGVGIDYSLFVVTRFREELRAGRTTNEAVVRAVATSGRAVALSGATVIVALAGMFLVHIQAFRSMAIGSMSVVAVAILAAITLLPAVLSVAGKWVDRLHIPFVGRKQPVVGEGFWHRWAQNVMRQPWAYLVASLALLLALAVPFVTIKLGQPGPGVLPVTEQPRIAAERLSNEFGAGVTGPMEILVDTPGGLGVPANLTKLERLTSLLQHDSAQFLVQSPSLVLPGNAGVAAYSKLYANGLSGVPAAVRAQVIGLADWSHGATLARVEVIGENAPESKEAEAFVDRVRNIYVPQAGLAQHALVGGSTAFNLDLEREISHRLPIVVGAVLLLSFLLLVMAFRSIVLPVKAMVMNLLSVGAAYGLIVALFQWGWGQSLLGFTSDGHIEVFVPLFLFSILFGLSMDYEVFLMSRMREEYLRTGSNELAVAHGLEGTARTITSAAAIMVTVFVAFAASRVVPFKEMGVGLAVAVFVDATVVRTILVPSAMKLMGDWNWWMPAWLDRLLPRIALETSPGEAPVGTPAGERIPAAV